MKQRGVIFLLFMFFFMMSILLMTIQNIHLYTFDIIQQGPGNVRCILGYKFIVNGRGEPVQALGPNGKGVPCPEQNNGHQNQGPQNDR